MELQKAAMSLEEKMCRLEGRTKKSVALVFLKEKDIQNTKRPTQLNSLDHHKQVPYENRLIQRAGFVRMRGQDTEWFQDQRYLPQQQAQYLRKLSRLREDLIQQQHSIINSEQSATLSDTSSHRDTGPKLYSPGSVVKRKAFPERSVKAHRDIINTSATNSGNISTRAAPRGIPMKLDPVSGQQLMHPAPASSRLSKSMDNIHLHTDDNGFTQASVEPQALKLPYLTSPSVPLLSARTDLSYEAVNDVIYTQRTRLKEVQNTPLNKPSIPMPARKVGPSNGFLRDTTHESFTQKVPMSKKTNRGLCRGKTNVGQFLRADTDEIQLPSNFYDLTLAEIQHGSGDQAPPTTPNVNKQNGGTSARGANYIPTLEEQRLIHYHYHTRDPRDTTRAGTRDMSTNTYNGQMNHSAAKHASIDQCVFCDQERKQLSEATANNSERSKENVNSNRVTFDLNMERSRSTPRRHIVVDLAHINDAKGQGDNNDDVNSATASVAASVPHLVVRSASPTKRELQTDQSATSLIKTFKQNELRRREVKNLLEDVKELNVFTETLVANN